MPNPNSIEALSEIDPAVLGSDEPRGDQVRAALALARRADALLCAVDRAPDTDGADRVRLARALALAFIDHLEDMLRPPRR